jgi:hypothetical protein
MSELKRDVPLPHSLPALLRGLGSACTANWEEDLPSSFAIVDVLKADLR